MPYRVIARVGLCDDLQAPVDVGLLSIKLFGLSSQGVGMVVGGLGRLFKCLLGFG